MKRMMLIAAMLWPVAASAEPLIIDNGRLFITARINGVETEALLDSGAEASLVDPKLAEEAKFGPGQKVNLKGSGGEQEILLVPNVRIEALGQTIAAADVAVLDLTDLSTRLIKRPIKAIVGREVFDAAPIRIDLVNSDARALGKDEVPQGTKLPLTEHNGIETVPVTLGARPAQAVLDFGNGSSVLIGKELAAELGLKPVGKLKGGGFGGEIERELVILPELTLAGRRFREVRATIDETSSRSEINVGTAILRHFVVTADFKGRAAWFEPVGEGQ